MERKRVFLIVAATFSAALFPPSATASAAVPAIYVFGDSLVDVGNNNFLPGNNSNANFLPFGIDFPGRKPTGRYTNGYNEIDYLAKELGFMQSPPAFLSISRPAQARRGVNFASGGAGILDLTNQNTSIPLNQQIRYFRGVSRRLRTRLGGRCAKHFLSKSIFFINIGSNDLFLFVAFSGIQNKTQQNLFVGELTNQFKNQLKRLYDEGARKFLVFGTSFLGCVPYVRLFVPGGECLEYLNNLSQEVNRARRIAMKELSSNLKGFSYSFINIYDFVAHLTSEPLKYGFTEAVSACCGSGRLNAESRCTPSSDYCPDRKKYIFWDSVHPTQAFYKATVRAVSRGDRYASPVTINQLVRL